MPITEFLINNGFDCVQELFEGACGFSYKAYDPQLKRNVFLKFYETNENINESILAEPRKIVSLFSEINDAGLHIAAVYDACLVKIDGLDYIQIETEFCEGASLYKCIKESRMYVYDALEFGKQIIDGLFILHKKNIVHRDIKPSNLVLSNGNIKIIDLGGAKELPDSASYLESKSKHSVFYRPLEYFAPQNIYGKFSDIYQVGLVVYEMINGPVEENVEHYLVKSVVSKYEKKYKCLFESMDDCQKSEVEDESIRVLITRDELLPKGRSPSRWYIKKLKEIVKHLSHKDYCKRASMCNQARIILSSYVGPNWMQPNDNELFIRNFEGYDYHFIEYEKKGKKKFESFKAKTGEKSRKDNSITSWEDVYKKFFEKYD